MKNNYERTVCRWFWAFRSLIICVFLDAIAICTEVASWRVGATGTHLNWSEFVRNCNKLKSDNKIKNDFIEIEELSGLNQK